MKYLVTGGAGFIGRHLVKTLKEQGHSVRVFDNLSSLQWIDFERDKETLKEIFSNEDLIVGDIRNIHEVEKAGEGMDGIFHLGAISRTPPAVENPVMCHDVNVTGTLNVLEAARKYNIKVVASSSNVIYAFPTMYRMSKEAVEKYCEVYNKLYGVKTVALCYSNVYGDGFLWNDPAVFASLRKSKVEQGYIKITGDGEQSRDFTHVSDIVKGNILAMEGEFVGRVDLCTGKNWTMNQVAKLIDAKVEYIPERKGDIKDIIQDSKPAKELLKWEASVELEDGIKDIFSN